MSLGPLLREAAICRISHDVTNNSLTFPISPHLPPSTSSRPRPPRRLVRLSSVIPAAPAAAAIPFHPLLQKNVQFLLVRNWISPPLVATRMKSLGENRAGPLQETGAEGAALRHDNNDKITPAI